MSKTSVRVPRAQVPSSFIDDAAPSYLSDPFSEAGASSSSSSRAARWVAPRGDAAPERAIPLTSTSTRIHARTSREVTDHGNPSEQDLTAERADSPPAHVRKEILDLLVGTHINTEGTIAAGKSSLCRDIRKLCEAAGYPCRILQEDIVQDYLGRFIADKRRHALGFQLDVFQNRVNCFMKAKFFAREGEIVITDRGLAGDWIFARHNHALGNMDSGEYSVYNQRRDYWAKELAEILPTARTLYLRVSDETMVRRMEKRNRPGESGYEREYLVGLNHLHDEVLLCDPNCVAIDWNEDRYCESKDLVQPAALWAVLATIAGERNPELRRWGLPRVGVSAVPDHLPRDEAGERRAREGHADASVAVN